MSSAAVRAAVDAYLVAGWSTLPLVATSNLDPSARPAGGFVTTNYQAGRETPISLGNPGAIRYREEGRVLFTVFVPAGVNSDADAETYANQIRAVFRGRHFSGVRVHGVEPPTDRATDGRFYAKSVSMPYTFDNFG